MVTTKMIRSQWRRGLPPRRSIVLDSVTHDGSLALNRSYRFVTIVLALLLGGLVGCGPRAHVPPVPPLGAVGADTGKVARLARAIAPVLYLQRDESFPLSRAVAIVHPSRRIIAYHLLWKDDVFGAWIPKTVPTDEEIVWVGYDTTGAPTEVWTYWHGSILHTRWPKRQVAIDVQWGKHGSLPHGILLGDLPRYQTLNSFYFFQSLLMPDFWLGNLTRRGPFCFCHGYRRYRAFDHPMLLANHIDAVIVAEDPHAALEAIFGHPYSQKPPWPWKNDLSKVKEIS